MKKNKSTEKKSLKRQLLSGTIYVGLSAVVVAVAVNTTVGIISDKANIPSVDETVKKLSENIPNLPQTQGLSLPELTLPENEDLSGERAVSESAEGIDSVITDILPDIPEIPTESISENIRNAEPLEFSIPSDANLGLSKFIKPFDGYVSKEHSLTVPVYSPTMSDYRTHTGVDIVESVGTEVLCVNGGIVTDVYNDDLYGMTVEIKNRDGYVMKYSNLLPVLGDGIEKGKIVKTGDIIGGIGETAICEAAESPHLHLEIYDSYGIAVDPEDLISF